MFQKELEAPRSCQKSSALSVNTVVQHAVARYPDVPLRGAQTPPFARRLAELAGSAEQQTAPASEPGETLQGALSPRYIHFLVCKTGCCEH